MISKNIKIPEGWEERKLKTLFTKNISGDWGHEPSLQNSYFVIGTPNFDNDGKIDYRDLPLRSFVKGKLSQRLIRQGNILLEKSGGSPDQPAGRVVYCDRDLDGTCSNFVQLLEPDSRLDSKFVFYLLSQYYREGRIYPYQQKTTGIINFKFQEYFEEFCSIPSKLPEQSKIAEILSTVGKAIDKTEALIQKYQRIKQGLMQDLLTKGMDENGDIRSEKTHKFKNSPLGRIPEEWEVNPIGKECKQSGGSIQTGPFGSQLHAKDYKENGIPIITVEHLAEGKILHQNLPLVGEADYRRLRKYVLKYGDLVFSRVGAIDRCSFTSYKEEGWLFSGRCLRVRGGSRFDAKFLSYLLNYDTCRQWILNNAVGSTMKCLNTTILSNLPIKMPTLPEQSRIASILSKVDETIDKEQAYKQKLLSLKSGLMEDLLTGKVRVNHLLN
ncbi:MAG: restriction endonuclease subunit S [Thermodesulfovibrionales bacterium]|nr:restriction endonuclease subunit S [Thermodesulfovibrionales bacterium]